MSEQEWWRDPQFNLGQFENEDTHVTSLHGRVVNGVWEYAAVQWQYRVPTVLWTLREGILTGGVE